MRSFVLESVPEVGGKGGSGGADVAIGSRREEEAGCKVNEGVSNVEGAEVEGSCGVADVGSVEDEVVVVRAVGRRLLYRTGIGIRVGFGIEDNEGVVDEGM